VRPEDEWEREGGRGMDEENVEFHHLILSTGFEQPVTSTTCP